MTDDNNIDINSIIKALEFSLKFSEDDRIAAEQITETLVGTVLKALELFNKEDVGHIVGVCCAEAIKIDLALTKLEETLVDVLYG